MKTNEVIITGYSNATSEGITIHTNIEAKLKTGNVRGKTMWVSWDKIGEALLSDYVQIPDVEYRNKLRKEVISQ